MQLEINTTKKITETVNVEPQTYYKQKGYSGTTYTGFYSEVSVLQMSRIGAFISFQKSDLKSLYEPERIFAGEQIDAAEFYEAIEAGMNEISALLMVGPQLQTA
jgi:hypothetical protein